MQRLVVAALVAVLLAMPGRASAQERREPLPWTGLDVPYVAVKDARTAGRLPRVRFHGTKVAVPFDDGILSMTATADAAIAMANDYCYGGCYVENGHAEFYEGSLFEIAADGTTGIVERRSLGIPLADPLGHTAFWTKHVKRHVRLTAYDTRSHTKLRGPRLPLGSRVYAVEGDTAYLNRPGQDGPDTTWSWTPSATELQQVVLPPGTDPDAGRLVSDVSHGRILSMDWRDGPTVVSDTEGNVLAEVPALLGTFSPDGRYVAHLLRRVELFDVDTGAKLALKGLGQLRSYDYRWSPDGRLVVTAKKRGGYDDVKPVRRFVCLLPSARCRPLAGRSALFLEPQLESYAFGQFLASLLPYVSRSSKAPERYLRQR